MNYPVVTIAHYSLLEAIRGKIIWIIASLLFIAILLSIFIGQTALTETLESQVALMSGFLRLSSVVVIIFFVISSIARDFQDKSIELLFAVSMPRYQVFLGKLFGFSLLAALISIIFGIGLMYFSDVVAVLIWSLSLWCELTLVALISLLLILSLENIAISLVVSVGAYLLMRIMPAIQSMGDGPFQDNLFNQFVNTLLDIIDFLLPRLDHFSQSSWLVSGSAGGAEIMIFILEFVLFVSLFILLGVIDLKRKEI